MMNLDKYKKIVIKVGTSQLFDPVHLNFQESWFASLMADIKILMAQDISVFVVTAGSVAISCQEQGLKINKVKTQEKQILSSIGMTALLDIYQKQARGHGIIDIAPIFMSIDDTENRKKISALKEITSEISAKKMLPVFIHNDMLSSAEIRFGDNDRFAAKVAHFMDADLMVMFSRVDGLYSDDPTKNHASKFVKEVYEINNDIENMAQDSILGTGGMSVKVNAAKIAISSECDVVIMNGAMVHPLQKLTENCRATIFWHKKESKMRYILE